MQPDPAASRQCVFITGAGSGIGRAVALRFAQAGWLVGAVDRNTATLDVLQRELGEACCWCRTVDVTDRSALLDALAAFSRAGGGGLDLLFNNAGVDAKGPFESMPWEVVTAVVNVNLAAGLALIQAAIPLLRRRPGSLVLSTASASAIFGTANMAVYSATKHAIKGLTEALAVELAPHRVRAADLLPGIVDTGMLADADKARLPKEGMLRVLTAEEVADVAWQAWHGAKVHWYVPSELADYDLEVTARPEAARDRRIAGSF
jgi:NAD(P)-dependent dehydrogenase (short-subunit alcohol dehydrogenase family)